MPNIWTHFLFGRELAETLELREATATPELLRVYQLGCQGPDFLFYHRFLPWQTGIGMPELGSAMHTRRCGPFLLDLLREAKGKPLQAPKTVYTLGFLTHHILDRNAHPYVFYRSGFKKWNHQRFEIFMDTLVARRKLGIGTWNTPVWKEIYTGERMPGQMSAVFDRLARVHYPELADRFGPSDWDGAYRDMIRAQKLFHDPSGLKRLVTFGKIEPFLFKRRVPPLDLLNESRREWLHPSLPEEKHTESFWDLWDAAMEDGLTVMKAALNFIEAPVQGAPAEDAERHLEACLGDRSYETGKPCDEGHRIEHADPIF